MRHAKYQCGYLSNSSILGSEAATAPTRRIHEAHAAPDMKLWARLSIKNCCGVRFLLLVSPSTVQLKTTKHEEHKTWRTATSQIVVLVPGMTWRMCPSTKRLTAPSPKHFETHVTTHPKTCYQPHKKTQCGFPTRLSETQEKMNCDYDKKTEALITNIQTLLPISFTSCCTPTAFRAHERALHAFSRKDKACSLWF